MTQRRRSPLSPDEARKRYIRIAETVLLEQIQVDARRLDREDDERRVAVGPFAKLNAEQVAATADGKSRGAITNLFRSQRQFQLQAMALVLEDPEVDVFVPPDPRAFDDPVEWIEAVGTAESERGPLHEMEPAVGYGLNWTLWLSQVPYGVWSERIADAEHARVPALGRATRTGLRSPCARALLTRGQVPVDDAGPGLGHEQPGRGPLAQPVPLARPSDAPGRPGLPGVSRRDPDALAGGDPAGESGGQPPELIQHRAVRDPALQEPGELSGRHRSAEVVALGLVALVRPGGTPTARGSRRPRRRRGASGCGPC